MHKIVADSYDGKRKPDSKLSTRLAFVPDAKLQLLKNYSGMHRKQNFRIVFFFEKVSLSPRLLLFAFSPPGFFCLSFPVLFFFCWAFTRLSFCGKRFSKKFEEHECFLKEVGVGTGTRFSLEFSGQSYTVFASCSGLFN